MTRPSQPVDLLTHGEAMRVVEAFSRRHATGVRNRAMLAIMWRSGLRSAEARGLRMDDVDLSSHVIHVRHGDTYRRVGIDSWGRHLLELWYAKRWGQAEDNLFRESGTYFCTCNGGEVSGQYLRRAFRLAGQRARIGKRVHPHVFRHMFAVEMSQRGETLAFISRAMGHADDAITAEYLRQLRFPVGRVVNTS